MRKRLAITLLTGGIAAPALALPASGATAPAAQPAPGQTIAATAAGDQRFTTLVALAQRAGLADQLAGDGKLTLFAPTNRAFEKVPAAKLRELRRHRAKLRRVLLYHVVAGDVKAEQVVQLRSARTLAGPKVRVRVRSGNVYLNRRAKVVQPDVAASNGTIHVINRVLLPPR